jgi:hypothetical protein
LRFGECECEDEDEDEGAGAGRAAGEETGEDLVSCGLERGGSGAEGPAGGVEGGGEGEAAGAGAGGVADEGADGLVGDEECPGSWWSGS